MLGILYMTRAGLEMRGTGAEADFQLPTLFSSEPEVAVGADIPEPVTEDTLNPSLRTFQRTKYQTLSQKMILKTN